MLLSGRSIKDKLQQSAIDAYDLQRWQFFSRDILLKFLKKKSSECYVLRSSFNLQLTTVESENNLRMFSFFSVLQDGFYEE
jgi:hypothetical protein